MVYRKAHYKYVLVEDYTRNLRLVFPDVTTDFFSIKDNTITAVKGYAWDGASGPTIDTKNSMKAGLVHDCIYQAIRLGLLDKEQYKPMADREFYLILRAEGMCWLRAKIWYLAVSLFGKGACDKLSKRDKNIEI